MVQSGVTPRVAIVGAGPSGLFSALTLLEEQPGIKITVFDRIDQPFGLLRYGVAPDHKSFKKIQDRLATVFEHEDVSFETNRTLGKDLTREWLKQNFDAIIYATGASMDVPLGITGQELPGSKVSNELIKWYNGHPEADAVCLDGVEAVAVVGLGNVAMDLARILAAPAGHLSDTHAPEAVCQTLADATIKDVWVLGRRGPQHAAFTTPELREILNLPGVRTVIHGVSAEEIQEALAVAGIDRRVKNNLTALSSVVICPTQNCESAATDIRCTVHFHFWCRPVEVLGKDKVSSVTIERTALVDGRVKGTGETFELPIEMIVAAIGYRGVQMDAVPFNEASGIIHNIDGRVTDPMGEELPGEYVAGWAKRGATGVIGNAKSDGVEAARQLIAYLNAN